MVAKTIRLLVVSVLGALCVYGLVYADLVLRAREAYREGEKYFSWHENPEAKRDFFEKRFLEEKLRQDESLRRGELTEEGHRQRLELARFEAGEKIRESSVKYAYVWYQTAAELFSPPESKWVRLSRQKMAQAKEIWKKELKQKGIDARDYMFE